LGKNVVGGEEELEEVCVGLSRMVKLSPAPSQSEPVNIGVCICTNSFSYVPVRVELPLGQVDSLQTNHATLASSYP
jgi:hypothetical protein